LITSQDATRTFERLRDALRGKGKISDFYLQLIPLQYRLLAINAVNIPWNAFLSLQNAKGRTAEKHSIELAKMV